MRNVPYNCRIVYFLVVDVSGLKWNSQVLPFETVNFLITRDGNLSLVTSQKQTLQVWRAALISTNSSVPFAVYDVDKTWEFIELR